MPRCEHTDTCTFFVVEVGYSPELNEAMKKRYCLEDNTECARRLAMDLVGRSNVPDEMLPTDVDLLEELKKSHSE
jgi:hypothetical protein